MLRINLLALFFVSAIGLSACGESTHTVSWWKNQENAKLEDFVAECKNDSAKEITAECQNAIKAKFQKGLDTDGFNSPSIKSK